jgi:uncharacterized protein YidB (DUF937 family)
MKRLVLVATAVVALASIPGTASAQEDHGCQAFGLGAAATAQASGGLGEIARAEAPVNVEVAALHAQFCV